MRLWCRRDGLNGDVVGRSYCGEYYELLPKAKVVADVEYKSNIHIAAFVTDKLSHYPCKDLKVVELKPHVQI